MTQTPRIDTESPEAGRLLHQICTIVLGHGGEIHPGAQLIERGGEFRVEAASDARQPDQALFRLPRELLVPVQRIDWDSEGAVLRPRTEPRGLTRLQQHLLELHLALYNNSDRLGWARTHLPALALRRDSRLWTALQAVRPESRPAREPATALTFIKTRLFWLPTAEADVGSSRSTQPRKVGVLMPLVDLLNHHPKGAPFCVDAQHLWIPTARSGGEAQCFARYGLHRDVLDLALDYGYADPHTPFARCAPVELELAGIGRLYVGGSRAKPRHPLNPPEVILTDDALRLSHLACHVEHPERLQGVLRLGILSAARRRGMTAAAGEHGVEQALLGLRRANLDRLEALRTAAGLSGDLPVGALLAKAAALQARIIEAVMRPQPDSLGATPTARP